MGHTPKGRGDRLVGRQPRAVRRKTRRTRRRERGSVPGDHACVSPLIRSVERKLALDPKPHDEAENDDGADPDDPLDDVVWAEVVERRGLVGGPKDRRQLRWPPDATGSQS